VEQGSNLNIETWDGETVLSSAFKTSKIVIIIKKYLIEHGAK